jgi:hypothetical protein
MPAVATYLARALGQSSPPSWGGALSAREAIPFGQHGGEAQRGVVRGPRLGAHRLRAVRGVRKPAAGD